MTLQEAPRIDFEALARRLAANADVDWDGLGTYPGYTRNAWRQKTKRLAKLYTQSV